MPRLSRQTKETIKTIVVLVIVALLLVVYVIYPLNRVKTLMGRADLDSYNPDSLAVNDVSLFQEAGLPADTFRVDADGLTTVAGVYIPCNTENNEHIRGTVLLIPPEDKTIDSLVPLATELHDSGYVVAAYDQRASGSSSGKYHGEGLYESNDLQAVISYLEIRAEITHPLTVVGFRLGADASLLAEQEEGRINAVVAVNPYLTTRNLLDETKTRTGTHWFPFYRTTMFWWYNIRSSYAAQKRTVDQIKPVVCRTLVLVPESREATPAVEKLKDVSPADRLTIEAQPQSREELNRQIMSFVGGVQ
ncbi:MAG TPA: hypothetical protein VJ983_03455 [candidate division Zixibacteria bacterium]|nr:hypothetical protein [candidate division Zixibacteria bacterium]